MKALFSYLEAKYSLAVADEWLTTVGISREDLNDETRPMPLTTLHEALVAFENKASRAELSGTWEHLVAPDNLGGWVGVLRGTNTPGEAFDRLEPSDAPQSRTVRWETLEAGDAFWKGRAHITHNPAIERDGLMSLARTVELSAIPALFGFGRATLVTCKPVVQIAGIFQEFEVRWRVPKAPIAAVLGGALGAGLGSVSLMVNALRLEFGFGAMLGAAVVGALAGGVWAGDRSRRAHSHAQRMRVQALERSIVLKEARDRSAAMTMEGAVIAGQYRIVRRMGAGASGVIYEAVRIGDGQTVAIKLLRAAAAHDAVASDRLRREAEALGLSWHPNVVEVLDHGVLPDGTSFLVMEVLHGESLASRLAARGALTLQELLPIALQVCDALTAVHAAGVVHRDLKPSNIFLVASHGAPDQKVSRDWVKLLDFGVARVEWEETRITNMGVAVGTRGYMSPEQEEGGDVDARSDLFAVGALLYECLVGEPPPPVLSSGVMRAANGDVDDGGHLQNLTRARAGVPPECWAIIEKSMAFLPEDRYEDARALAAALRAVGRGKNNRPALDADSAP